MKVYDIDRKICDYRYLDWTESAVTSGTFGGASVQNAPEEKANPKVM